MLPPKRTLEQKKGAMMRVEERTTSGAKREREEECSFGVALGTLPTDPSGQLNVLGHDGHPLGMDGAKVGVLKEANKVCFTRFLESSDGRALEAQIGLEVLCNLAHEALERQLADEQLSGFLVTTDLPEGHGAGPVAMGLLDAARRRGALARCLGGQLLAGRLATGRLTGGLLGTGHR